ncbi:MAG TPA: SRPBCC domain-containing protein, partial [Thermoflexales bacterium]|nr:SRPBCC domain-containing protein [Thermoflexales bacterium]
HEMDVRPGGVWRFIMHGPDGVDYPNRISYKDVVKPERLVYLHDSDDDTLDDPRSFVTTVTFDVEIGKTRLTMRARLPSREAREAVVGYAVEGAKQTLGRLADYLHHE